MKKNKKFLIRGHGFTATVEVKFNSNKGNWFSGQSEKVYDEIFKNVLRGLTGINLDIAIEEKK